MYIQGKEMRQKGFTLIEIMVTLAVGGVLLIGAVTSIFQVNTFTSRSNDQIVALTDVDHAALLLRQDLQMAQGTSLTDGVPISLTDENTAELNWTDFTTTPTFETAGEEKDHSSAYTLSGTELVRTYDSEERIIGRHITSIEFRQNGNIISVVITATGPGAQRRNETLEFSVHLRSEGMQQ